MLTWDDAEPGASTKTKRRGEADWPKHYAALLEYEKEFGHCNVHKKFKHEDYTCVLKGMGEDGEDFHYAGKLGTWLANQRSFHSGRRGRTLSSERDELLQKLVDDGKLLWNASEMSGTKAFGQATWPLNFAALLQYRLQYGHCNVSQNFHYECVLPGLGENGEDVQYSGNLGRWLMTQRQSKKGQRNRLSPQREAQLQRLHDEGVFAWDPTAAGIRAPTVRRNTFGKHMGESDWDIHYLALIEYSKVHGTCNVPQKDEFECDIAGMGEDGQPFKYKGRLGQWVRSQRQLKRALDAPASESKRKPRKSEDPDKPILIQTLSPEREAKLQLLVDQGTKI